MEIMEAQRHCQICLYLICYIWNIFQLILEILLHKEENQNFYFRLPSINGKNKHTVLHIHNTIIYKTCKSPMKHSLYYTLQLMCGAYPSVSSSGSQSLNRQAYTKSMAYCIIMSATQPVYLILALIWKSVVCTWATARILFFQVKLQH